MFDIWSMKRCVRHIYFKAMSHITTDTYSWYSCTQNVPSMGTHWLSHSNKPFQFTYMYINFNYIWFIAISTINCICITELHIWWNIECSFVSTLRNYTAKCDSITHSQKSQSPLKNYAYIYGLYVCMCVCLYIYGANKCINVVRHI